MKYVRVHVTEHNQPWGVKTEKEGVYMKKLCIMAKNVKAKRRTTSGA